MLRFRIGNTLANTQNHVIALLPRNERLRLLAVCEPLDLVFADVLCEPGERTRYVYFPVDGFISLLTQIDGKAALEVGMVGREGMLCVQLALGVMANPCTHWSKGRARPGALERVPSNANWRAAPRCIRS